ncbi:MAG: hypothetical protein ABIR92_09865, partial [Gemmatimonadaceae bacterium]
YVDLFGNCWVAVAICVLARAFLFEEFKSPALLAVGLVSLVAAAWSKLQLVAIVVPGLAVYLIAYRPWLSRWGAGRRWRVIGFAGAILLASAPYVRNLVVYGNPLWPADFPIFPDLFARGIPELRDLMSRQRPPALVGATQLELFARSILEIGHPMSYPHRHRWIVDQGNSGIAFRSGGFWNVAVVIYVMLMGAMLVWLKGRRGAVALGAFALMLLFVGVLPQSHELRYFLFIPLVWAAVIAMLYPLARARGALPATMILVSVAALFTASARLTRDYYRIEPVTYASAARAWGADIMWKYLGPGHTYCAVGNEPRAFFLAGPTMREFRIASRADERNCPAGSIPVIGNMVYYDRPVLPR